jgi:hypothetical protein
MVAKVKTWVAAQRGQSVGIYTLLVTFAVALIMGIAVDLCGAVYARDAARDVAGQAARLGGNQVVLTAIQDACWTPEIDTRAAKTAIASYLRRTDYKSKTVKVDTDTVSVTVVGSWKPLFLGMFGVGDIAVSGQGSATVAAVLDASQMTRPRTC